MYLTGTVFLIKVMAAFYILAAITAILLYKKHKAANIVPNLLCIIAAVAGIAASTGYLLNESKRLVIFDLKFPVPFMSFNIGMDGLSAFFTLCLSVLSFCVSIYSLGYMSHYYYKRNIGLFNFLYSGFILSMFLVLTAGNTICFLIVWEVMSLLSYFLVVFESENKDNQRAGTLYIIMTHVGTAFLIVAFMIMFSYTGTFDVFSNADVIPGLVKNVLFILFFIGFGTKAGIIPLHIWLPYAHPAASSNISALMSGIMIKTAVYGLVRFLLSYLEAGFMWWGVAILIAGAVSTFLGVAYALMEHNIKRLLAYCSIENIGIILIGLGVSMTSASKGNMVLSSLALIAALFHTFNHALYKGGLFLGAGSVQYSTHTKDIEELGGLIKSMPYTGVFMLCFSLAICAVVPFNGFVSEWLTYQSLFQNISPGNPAIGIITILSAATLAIAGAMALACFVKMFGIAFLGKPRSSHSSNAKEVPSTMRIGMGILALLCLLLGLFPINFMRLADRAVSGVSGVSILSSLQGKLMFVFYPVSSKNNSITPLLALVAVLIAAVGVFVVVRLLGGKSAARKFGTWDCGFHTLTPRMQYTATGFSKPFCIVFKILYKPHRELQVEDGLSPYHPKAVKYAVKNESIFEKYFYVPALYFVKKASKKLKYTIQTGSVHLYLIYIFAALLALMLYNSLS